MDFNSIFKLITIDPKFVKKRLGNHIQCMTRKNCDIWKNDGDMPYFKFMTPEEIEEVKAEDLYYVFFRDYGWDPYYLHIYPNSRMEFWCEGQLIGTVEKPWSQRYRKKNPFHYNKYFNLYIRADKIKVITPDVDKLYEKQLSNTEVFLQSLQDYAKIYFSDRFINEPAQWKKKIVKNRLKKY